MTMTKVSVISLLSLIAVILTAGCGAAVSEDIVTPQESLTSGASGNADISPDAENNAGGAVENADAENTGKESAVSGNAGTSGEGDADTTAQRTDETAKENGSQTSSDTGSCSSLVIDICGAVMTPGVYELPEGSRVVDAVEAAGGLAPDADRRRINEAALLSDGEQIIVPLIGEDLTGLGSGQGTSTAGMTAGGQGSGAGGTDTADGLININTADAAALETLPGVGATRARMIIDDRNANGPFQTTEDIMRVSGIGENLYNRFKDRITVG